VLQDVAKSLVTTVAPTITPHSFVYVAVNSDQWRAYHSIQSELNLQHRTVNHSVNFIDPDTSVHTQTIESYWAKYRFKEMKGVSSHLLPSRWLQACAMCRLVIILIALSVVACPGCIWTCGWRDSITDICLGRSGNKDDIIYQPWYLVWLNIIWGADQVVFKMVIQMYQYLRDVCTIKLQIIIQRHKNNYFKNWSTQELDDADVCNIYHNTYYNTYYNTIHK
jgi:hypothetical protein